MKTMKSLFYSMIAITTAAAITCSPLQSYAEIMNKEIRTEYLAEKVTIREYGSEGGTASSGTDSTAKNTQTVTDTASQTGNDSAQTNGSAQTGTLFGKKTGPGAQIDTQETTQTENASQTETAIQQSVSETEAVQAVQYKTVDKRVTLDRVNVRKSPSTSADVLGLIEAGKEINYVKKYNSEWTEVKYNGKTAYIASRYIGIVKKKVAVTAVENAVSAQTDTAAAQAGTVSADTGALVQEIGLNSSWKYAAASQINSGKAVLYKASSNRKDKIIGVNAGHGTKGGEKVKTWSHPDKTAKVTGGTTAAGEVLSTAVSYGMTFNDGTAEAEVTLKTAQALKTLLLDAGYDVLMIRDADDVQLDNIARTVICNNTADCHIAIHFDSDGKNYDKGAFYCSVPDGIKYLPTVSAVWEQSEKLGDCLLNGLKVKGSKIFDNKSMDIDLTQTAFSTIPSVAIELGNACSSHDDRSLEQKAQGLLAGINEYFGVANTTVSFFNDTSIAGVKTDAILAGSEQKTRVEEALPWKKFIQNNNENSVSIAEMTEKAMRIAQGTEKLSMNFLAANTTEYLATQNKVEEHADGSGIAAEVAANTAVSTAEATENIKKLTTLSGIAVGTVLNEAQIDFSDTSKYFKIWKIEEGDNLYQRINGKSYKKNNNIKAEDLRYIKLPHYNFNGEVQVGEIIVNKSIADDVVAVFKGLFDNKYQIYSMRLIDDFWTGSAGTSDDASCYANNSSAFCYREATGSGKLSKHAMGLAIDINTQQNPYVTFSNGQPKWMHENASDYIDRTNGNAHMIDHNDLAYKLFTEHGFTWGGDWTTIRDYQHFEK